MELPKFCPNKECDWHNPDLDYSKQFTIYRTYFTKAHGIIQRFICKHCGKSFSEQTFRLNYYTKKVIDYQELSRQLVTNSSIRSMALYFRASNRTIQNRIGRLARQAIAVQSKLIPKIKLQEDLVADGFESFCTSQYYPNNINILVGKESQFLYFFDYVTIRRKGRMKECQKKKREELEKIWKAEKGGITKSFSKLLSKMVILAENSNRKELALYTDEHKQYVTAWIKHKELKKLKGTIECTHVQINSRLPRTVHNPLFSVNYMDREMRKDLPEHVRESTRFGRNVSDCNNRLILYQLWHNTEKKYRINLPAGEFISHLEMAGYDPDEWQIELDTIYTERRFISHVENMDDTGIDIWFRRIETPLKENPEYVPAFAAA